MRLKIVVTLIVLSLCAIIMMSVRQDNPPDTAAKEYMDYLNTHRIKGGCFYLKEDSVVTFRNYRK